MSVDIASFCRELPKLELHAHLNGSLSDKTLIEILNESGIQEKTKDELKCMIKMKERSLAECFQVFGLIHTLTISPSIIKKVTMDVIQEFSEDGVVYLELRSTPREVDGNMTKKEYINAVLGAIEESQERYPILVKLLISINRKNGVKEAEENLQLALKARNDYPNIIAGIDLSGNPSVGDIDDFIPIMIKAHDHGFPLAVHCAEVPSGDEIKKVMLLKPERLGHGTCIHPDAGGSDELWSLLKDLKIPIELCLTSNIMTATVKDYQNHHFSSLYKSGHPIVLGTDDKGVFCTSLSKEYSIAAKTFELNEEQLWQLSYGSISYAFASESEKEKLSQILKEWRKKNVCGQ